MRLPSPCLASAASIALSMAAASGAAWAPPPAAQAPAEQAPLAPQVKGKEHAPTIQDDPPRTVRVGVYPDAPFAMQVGNGRWGGYAVMILAAAAVEAHLVLDYREFRSLDDLYHAVDAGDVDLGVGNTLVTAKRLERFDFTQPMLDGGLRIMVPSERHHSLARLWEGLVHDGHVQVVLWGTAITIALSVVLLAVLRRVDREFTRHWHEGFAEALYHVVSVVITGKTSYKGKLAPDWVGRIFAALWLVFGVASVAYLTSSLTSVMTASSLSSQIAGTKDLQGKRVGTLTGSVGDRYCAEHGLDVVRFDDVEAAARAITAKSVDAVVADSQSLEYFDTSHPDVPVTEVGPIFERRHYAFPVRRGDDDLRRRIDIALTSLRETGQLDRIRERWFGH